MRLSRTSAITAALMAATIALAAISASGQAAGQPRGLLVGGSNVGNGANWLLQLDAQYRPTSLRTQVGVPAAAWPLWGNVYGMTMDADNRTVIIPGIASPTLSPLTLALVRYDPVARAVVGTLWRGAASTLTLMNWSNLTLNSDGDVVTIDNGHQPDTVAEFDVHAGTWRHASLPLLREWIGLGLGAGVGGCEWDAFRGGINHVTWYGSKMVPGYLWYTTYDYRSTTTLSPTLSPGLGGYVIRFGGTLMENDDWISSAGCMNGRPFSNYFFSRGRTGYWGWTDPGAGTTPLDVTHEKYAAPGRGFWTVNWWPQEVRYIDSIANKSHTRFVGTAATWSRNAFEILPLWSRDLGSRRTGKSTWDLFINPGAGLHAGRPFLIAASLKRSRPGLKLADGRQIFIGVDSLALLTAQGPVPPFLTGTHGTLDTTGVGTAQINLGRLGTKANGRVLHFCAVVLDPHAPSGIAWVCDPHAFVIDVLP